MRCENGCEDGACKQSSTPKCSDSDVNGEYKDGINPFEKGTTSFGDKKIQVIKGVREVTNLGLKEAKDLVEGVPQMVREKVSKDEAEKIKKKLEDAGGTVEIK